MFIAHLSKWGQEVVASRQPSLSLESQPNESSFVQLQTMQSHVRKEELFYQFLSSISNAINASTLSTPLSTSLIISSQISSFNSQLCIKDHTKSIICLKEKTVPTPISSADLRLLTASWKLHVCPASMWCPSLLLTLFAWRLLTHLQVTLEFRIIATLPCHDLRAGPDGS